MSEKKYEIIGFYEFNGEHFDIPIRSVSLYDENRIGGTENE